MDQSRELTDRFSSGTRHKTVEQFEDAWFRGETPDIDDYLRNDHNHGNVLIEMISIDLECRWRGLSRDSVSESERGDQVDDFPRRPLLEDYVQRFPAIGGLEQLPVVLMADEYRVRQCWGDRPSYDSYSARFPTRTAELNQALRDVDRVLTAESPWVGKQRGSDTGSRSIDLNKSTLLENETPNGERASDGRLRDQSGDGSLAADIGRFGDYVLLEEIARGGMGIVYKAWQPNLDRTVALKMLLAGEFADEDQVRRFQVEAEAAAQLDHPGIVPIYEVGQHKGQHYFTMAYADGEDLRSVVARGPLQPLEAATIICRVAEAVHYAHTRGVIHRDLKPSNVLVGTNGEPRVTDFGLAKRVEMQSDLTSTGQIMGTPSYMSPEQAAGKVNDIGKLSDVYSLGSILYELLTGRPPFQAESVWETIKQVMERQPDSPRQLNPAIHRDVETICLKAIAKAPADRYASAAELASDLARFIAGEAILARRESIARKLVRRIRRRPVASTLLIALLVFAGVAGYFWSGMASANRISAVENQLNEILDEDHWKDLDASRVNELIDELAQLSSRHAERQRMRVRDRLDTLIRESNPLNELDEIERVLTTLGKRDPFSEAKLREVLKQRLATSLVAFDSASADFKVESVFDPGLVEISENGALSRKRAFSANGSSNATSPRDDQIITRVSSAGNVEFEVEFDESWEDVSKIGLSLKSSRTHTRQVVAVAFSPDCRTLATASATEVILWDVQTGRLRAVYEPKSPQLARRNTPSGSAISFSADGAILVASILSDSHVRLLDTSNARVLRTFEEEPRNAICLSISPDGNTLGIGDRRDIKLYDTTSWQVMRTLSGHTNIISTLAFSGDSTMLATGSLDKAIRLWSLDSDQEPLILSASDWQAHRVAFNRDGSVLASTDGSMVKLWDTATGEVKADRFQHGGARSIAFSADGKQLAVAGSRLSIWNAENLRSQQLVRKLGVTKQTSYHAVTFSPDGRRIAAGMNDNSVAVWKFGRDIEEQPMQGTGYSFVLTTSAHSFRSLRSEGGAARLQVLRNRVPLLDRQLDMIRVPSGPLTLRVGLQGTDVDVQVNDLDALTFRDVFALNVESGGNFGLHWPAAVRLRRLIARRQAVPQLSSPLEQANGMFAAGQYRDALNSYQEYASRELPGNEVRSEANQEARFKSALCLLNLNRRPQKVEEIFEQISSEPGEQWPIVAGCQLWLIHARRQNLEQADKVFSNLKDRFSLEELTSSVSPGLRSRIVDEYRESVWGMSVLLNRKHVAENLEKADRIEEYFRVPMPDRFRTKRSLARAYWLDGRLALALTTAANLMHNRQNWPAREPFPFAPLGEYLWMLRHNGQPDRALAEVDQYLFEEPGKFRQGHEPLLVERARILVALEKWDEAERDLKQYFDSFDPRNAVVRSGAAYEEYSSACMAEGFLRERRGDTAGATKSWNRGLYGNWIQNVLAVSPIFAAAQLRQENGMGVLQALVLGSLTGKLTDVEAHEVMDSVIERAGHTLLISMFISKLTTDELTEMCRSPLAREYARKLAFREVSLGDYLASPGLLIGVASARRRAFNNQLTAEQEEITWDAVEKSATAVLSGRLQPALLLPLGNTALSGETGFLGWASVKVNLDAELRGPLAYVLAHRCLRLNKQPDARILFRDALQNAPPDSPLLRLSQRELEKIKE